MKIFKSMLLIVAVAIVLFFAGQTIVIGSSGLEGHPWVVNGAASGIGGSGFLSMVALEENTVPNPCSTSDTEMRMYFSVRLKFGGNTVIYSDESENTVCHPDDYGEKEATELHKFLKKVLVEQTGGDPASPYSTCVVNLFDTPTADDCPNILRSMKYEADTELRWTIGLDKLSHMSDVVVRIPR